MKKLMSKLVAFALVAVLAFALTGCFAPNANTAITFNKYPEATYVQNTDANSALSAIEVTLTENGVVVKKGNLADLEKEGVIVVEGFDLATLGANKTAKIIFGTAVVNFNYSVVAETAAITDTAGLEAALAVAGTSVAKLGENGFALTKALTVAENAHVVLDLNGKTLTAGYASGEAMITVAAGATLEVKNGTIENKQLRVAGIFVAAGELVIHSGTFTDYGQVEGEATEIGGELIEVLDGGVVTIYGGTFAANYDETVGTLLENGNYGREAVVVKQGGTAKIYDGKFSNESIDTSKNLGSSGLYGSYLLNSYGTTFIYGGEFVGQRGALGLCAGSFDIRGGKFTGNKYYALYTTGSAGAVTGVVSGGEFYSASGNLIYAGNDSEVEGGLRLETTLVISGGKFQRVDGAKASYAIYGSSKIANVTVTGGEWYNIPATGAFKINCFEEGYSYSDANGDKWFEIVKA